MDSYTSDESTNGRAASRRRASAQTDQADEGSYRPTTVGQPSRSWAMGQRLGRRWAAPVVSTPYTGRPDKLSDEHLDELDQLLRQGALAAGFPTGTGRRRG